MSWKRISRLPLKIDRQKIYRIDTIWAYLSIIKIPDDTPRLIKLSKVAWLVLTLPHSNAEERVFSVVTKSKT